MPIAALYVFDIFVFSIVCICMFVGAEMSMHGCTCAYGDRGWHAVSVFVLACVGQWSHYNLELRICPVWLTSDPEGPAYQLLLLSP